MEVSLYGKMEKIQTGNEGRLKGKKEGIIEGIELGKKEVALKMLGSGYDKSVIMDLTKLSEEEILELEERGLHQLEEE